MVKFAVEFWWKMLMTIFPAKEAQKSSSKLRRKFATNFAENFANFTLEIAGAYTFKVFLNYWSWNHTTSIETGVRLLPHLRTSTTELGDSQPRTPSPQKPFPGEIKVSTFTVAALFSKNGLDRPENRYGRYGFASFYSISISTVGVDGARVCL